jgi:hypothetical protein
VFHTLRTDRSEVGLLLANKVWSDNCDDALQNFPYVSMYPRIRINIKERGGVGGGHVLKVEPLSQITEMIISCDMFKP